MVFGDFRFWILDFGDLRFWILGILDFRFWGVWILDFGAGIPNPKSKIPNPNCLAKFSGSWILDFGSLCSNSSCEAPTPHILDFGGDFEFWILDFGDLGFWILDIFGVGILDWQVVTKFWMLHKKRRLCTPTGSADFFLVSRIFVPETSPWPVQEPLEKFCIKMRQILAGRQGTS